MENRTNVIADICNYLPQILGEIILNLPKRVLDNLWEIRLRVDRPVTLTVGGENLFLSKSGDVCHLIQNGLFCVDKYGMEQCFVKMCGHSVYVHTDSIRQGFITLKNGCRVGIAGRGVYENGELHSLTDISSLNIRIATEKTGCAERLAREYKGGMIIAGPPGSGKTTLLRDLIRCLSSGIGTSRKRVTVVDSRNEIAAADGSCIINNLGALTDVLHSVKRSDGVEIALRTLNPQVIAFDEMSGYRDIMLLESCASSGVDVIATIHSESLDELYKKISPTKLSLIDSVKTVVVLKSPLEPYTAYELDSEFTATDINLQKESVLVG